MKGKNNDKICAISDTGRASVLAAQPTAYCSKCNAEAHDPSSLCSPVDIKSRASQSR
jgi:hypothetical protein